ncbi:autotransporter domain-containing protein [Ancylobacter sp. IITR112]|uniref:autotransporter outer membrane beta-barrel domain-containing protein n=1 Tax=Ancylobacter sp. IITR112 TaxID=3138073 RepID=UPI00352AAB1A
MTVFARPIPRHIEPRSVLPFALRLLMSGVSALALVTVACGGAHATGGNGAGYNEAVGGTDSATGAGNAGQDSASTGGGGGGGAGETGGTGGTGVQGANSNAGGAGGASPGAAGEAGLGANDGSGDAGGGGGGGAHGYVGAALPTDAVTGGGGGVGGGGDYYGGGGGAGGWGAVVTGTGAGTLTVDVTGGAGGAGGVAIATGADGGTGGTGLYFTDPSGFTLTVQSAVTGGDGGAGGVAYFSGDAGLGGAGILGQNLNVILGPDGSIAGGLGGDGVTRAAAVEFTGGVNSFELQGGATVTGNVQAYSSADTFRLGGADYMLFDVSRLDGDGSIDEGEQFIGFGIFEKVGTGTAALTGNNTEITNFSVLGGSLYVDGGLTNTAFSVGDGAFLGGSGFIGSLTANAGSVVSPGSAGMPGLLTVAGNVTFQPGSVYEVNISTVDGVDEIQANTATLNGGTVRVASGSQYDLGTTYRILSTTNGISGEFLGVDAQSVFLDFSVLTSAYNVDLLVSRNGRSFASVGATANQRAAGAGTESLGSGNAVYDAVLDLASVGAVQGAFDQLSGEIHASIQTALLEDSRFLRNAAWDRLRTVEGEAPGMWVQGFGSWGDFGGDANAAELSRTIGGVFLGADGVLFDNWRIGALAGYSHSDFDGSDRASSGSSDDYSLGLFAGTSWGPAAFRSGLAYTWHDIETERGVAFPGFSDQLSSSSDGGTFQVFGELGYGFAVNGATLEPFVNLAYVNLSTDGFTEAGGVAALSGASETMSTGFSTLGLRASNSFNLGSLAATAKGMVGWSAAFGDTDPSVSMTYASGSLPFAVSGVPLAENALVVEAGLDLAVSPIAAVGIAYGGMFGSDLSDQSFTAKLNVKF